MVSRGVEGCRGVSRGVELVKLAWGVEVSSWCRVGVEVSRCRGQGSGWSGRLPVDTPEARAGSWLQSASTRPLCEHGSCQCTRLTDVSSEAGLCRITAVFRGKWRGTQRRMPARPIFLNGLKRGTLRACNLLNGNLCPQTSSFLKRS